MRPDKMAHRFPVLRVPTVGPSHHPRSVPVVMEPAKVSNHDVWVLSGTNCT